MRIIETPITLTDLAQIALQRFGNMTKAVVDIEKEILVVDADLHADQEKFLLQQGSMSSQHQDLQTGWAKLSLVEQLANIGTEVGRALIWAEKGNKEYQDLAFWRAMELLNATIVCHTHSSSTLTELTRLKEVLGDYFVGENQYDSSQDLWNRYFYPYNYRVAILHGK